MADLDPVDLSPQEATTLLDGIRRSFNEAWDAYADGCRQLIEAHQGRAWLALGLLDWAAFVSHTLDVDHLKIPRAERQAIVHSLSDGGLSVRAIAAATGLGVGTVHREMAPPSPSTDVPNGTTSLSWLADFLTLPTPEWVTEMLSLIPEEDRPLFRNILHEQAAAIEALRTGVVPLPPHDYALASTLSEARHRLAEWELNVQRGAGTFLTWCQRAGITLRPLEIPDRLRYPVIAGDPPLPSDWTEEDEHHAALGHLATWLGWPPLLAAS